MRNEMMGMAEARGWISREGGVWRVVTDKGEVGERYRKGGWGWVDGRIGDGARSIANARGRASRSRRRGANVLLTLHPSAHAPFCRLPSPPLRRPTATTTFHPHHCRPRISIVDPRRRLTYLKDTDSLSGVTGGGGIVFWGEISENNVEQFRDGSTGKFQPPGERRMSGHFQGGWTYFDDFMFLRRRAIFRAAMRALYERSKREHIDNWQLIIVEREGNKIESHVCVWFERVK